MTRQKIEEYIESMSISTDILFSTVINNRPDVAELLLIPLLFLGFKIDEIKSIKTEDKKSHLYQHGPISDIEIITENDIHITVRIPQVSPTEFLLRNTLSSNNIEMLDQGINYNKIPKQILLVISKKDLIGAEKSLVTVRHYIEGTNIVCSDNGVIVFANLEYLSDDENIYNNFMRDLFESDYRKIKNPQLRNVLYRYKEREERMQVANSIQELINEEIKEYKDKYKKERQEKLKFQDELKRQNEEMKAMKEDNFKMQKIIEELSKNQK